jgi:erythromycin esterase-like protein
MKRIVVLFSLSLLLISKSKAQEEIEKYVKENNIPINAISPDSTDYTDLSAFGNAVGDARVVMIGEQDHGDAAAFLAKSRLIKYLHEKKGFNVLAFESDFFTLNYGWEEAKVNKLRIDSFAKRSIYALWTMCSACSDLFYNYIPSTFEHGTPLQLSGFDPQMGFHSATKKLDSVMRRLQLPDIQTEILINWVKHIKDTALNNQYLRELSRIRTELSTKVSKDDFWLLYIDNLVALDKNYTTTAYYERLKARDEQMGKNLIWLLRHKYADQKVIVWAHNYHISKDSGNYTNASLNAASTMGSYFTSHTPDIKTYILGFTSYEGTSGRLYIGNKLGKKYKLDKPKTNSFENWINPGYDFAFVDFQAFNSTHPAYREDFYLSGAVMGSLYHTSFKASWNNIFDGVFFIREMYPCEWIK